MTRERAINNYIDEDACCQGEVNVIRLINYIYDDFDSLLEKLGLERSSLEAKIAELEYQLEDNGTRAEEIISAREKHIELLHNQIAELEAPKGCDGCRYEKCDDHIEYRMNCGLCYRKITTPDYYKPKDTND